VGYGHQINETNNKMKVEDAFLGVMSDSVAQKAVIPRNNFFI